MRLLVLNYEFPPLGGGSSPVTASLCSELSRLGSTVDLVTMGYRGLPKVEKAEGVTIHRVPCLRSARHISFAYELLSYVITATIKSGSLMRRQPYDLVHSHFIVPSGMVAYLLHRRHGLPYVITAHGSDVPGYNPDRFRHLHHWIAPAWRRIVATADLITSPSEILASLIRRSTSDPVPIQLIPNAIDPDWNEAGPKRNQILVVSRLFERKGVQFLLQALEREPTGLAVHIVGDGPYLERLQRMAEKVDDEIVFHGWLKNTSPELKRLFRESRILVFPSEAENFPMVLLEAMVSGMAVIAGDIPGSREVLGDAAVYVPPRDHRAIRQALGRLIADQGMAESLGSRARGRATSRFSWQVVGRQYHDCFLSILKRTSETS